MKRRGSNKEITQLFQLMARDEARHAGFINDALREAGVAVNLGFLTQKRNIPILGPSSFITRLICRKNWICSLYYNFSTSSGKSSAQVSSNFQVVRGMVQ